MSQLAIDTKLTVRSSDTKWTEVAKKVINAIMDYASKTNKFRTVRIGEHSEVDTLPGFYIIFPGLDTENRIAYERKKALFAFQGLLAVKGENYQEVLQELLECYGALVEKFDEDHDMAGKNAPNGVPEVGVPEVRNIEIVGLSTGSGARPPAQSFEYLYGATNINVEAIFKPRG
jgi:hypothetical protein